MCLSRWNLVILGYWMSGITARTPNIFIEFLFDYTQQLHTNVLLTTQFIT
jgi:hypothetical protein